MSIGDLYPVILTLVLVGVLFGVGVAVLGQMTGLDGITEIAGQPGNLTDAGLVVNGTLNAIAGFVTWLPIIVLVVAAAIIIGLVIRSFRS